MLSRTSSGLIDFFFPPIGSLSPSCSLDWAKDNVLFISSSVAETQLASQTALLQQLKTYVGEQELRQSSSEREQLISRVQVRHGK